MDATLVHSLTAHLLVHRQQLHCWLGLPANRPLLRFANAVDPRLPQKGSLQPPASGKAVRLQNVHEGVAGPHIKGGEIHMIHGSYDYHHYMQVHVLLREEVTMYLHVSVFSVTVCH